MRNDHYPDGSVIALLNTDEVTSNTRDVLNQRLEQKETAPLFFDNELYNIARSVCDRLIPQTLKINIDLAGRLDAILNEGKGNGWRYDNMPSDKDAFRNGMYGIDETARILFEKSFIDISIKQQDEVLNLIQHNQAPGKTWEITPATLFFEELLSQLTEIYYSHPSALEDIGVVAFADAKGWQKTGLNELEKREPAALDKN